MPPLTMKDIANHSRSAANNAYEDAARLCEKEANACIGDIVTGDDVGAKLAHARAGALLTAAGDIRALIV